MVDAHSYPTIHAAIKYWGGQTLRLCNTYSIEGELNALVSSQVAEASRYIQIDWNDIAPQPVVSSTWSYQVSVVDADSSESWCVWYTGKAEQCWWEHHPVTISKSRCSQSILLQSSSTSDHHLHHHIFFHLYQRHFIHHQGGTCYPVQGLQHPNGDIHALGSTRLAAYLWK